MKTTRPARVTPNGRSGAPFVLLACATMSGCAAKDANRKPNDASMYNDPSPRSGEAKPEADHDKELAVMLAAEVRITTVMAQAIRVGAAVWQTANPGCPKASDVISAKMVPEAVRADDAWTTPFRIVCGAKNPTVISAGPDRAFDTKDDIVVGDR